MGEVSYILSDVYKYLTAHINIHNGMVQAYIPKPANGDANLWFFYAYILYDNCCLKGHYNKDDLEELIKVANHDRRLGIRILEQDPSLEDYYHPVIDTIIGLLASDTAIPKFYIDDEILATILSVVTEYEDREYSRTIDSSVFHARYSFFDHHRYRHPIYELTSSTQTSVDPLPSFLTDASATSNIANWPSIELIVNGYVTTNLPIGVSINDLVKFQAHLTGFNHLRLFIQIPQLNEAENKKFLDSLVKHLSHIDENGKEMHLLGSAGSLRLPVLFGHEKKEPHKLIKHLAEFMKKYFEENHKEVVIDLDQLRSSLSLYFKNFSQKYGEMSYGSDGKTGLALFESIKILKLLYQTLSCKPEDKDFPKDIYPCLWQEQIDKILEVLGYTLKVAVRVRNISTQSDFEDVLWNISKSINKRIISGESIILQLGNPKISSVDSSGHAFYVIIQSLNSKAKIIIIDGEDREVIDPAYDVVDKGKGVRILCRETIEFSLEQQNKIFLRNYIYKALKLKHEVCVDQNEVDKLLKNVKLKSSTFIGKYSELTSIPSMELQENTHSIASQNFEDCTMYNLRESFRVLFNWNSAQMAHFMTDSICRFNFLLYQNGQHIDQITMQSQALLKSKAMEMYKKAAGMFLQLHYSGQGHEVLMVPLDGNCFYHSISDLLVSRGVLKNNPETHISLRNLVVNYLRLHPEYITNNGIEDLEGYLNIISNHGDGSRDGEWADSIQVRAMLEVIRGYGIDNIALHTDNNHIQLADTSNINLSNVLHIYYFHNHYMAIVENPSNPIHIEVDVDALRYEAMIDYGRMIIPLRNDSSVEDYSTESSRDDNELTDEEVLDNDAPDDNDDFSQNSGFYKDDAKSSKRKSSSTSDEVEENILLGFMLNNLYSWIKILPQWLGDQILNTAPIKAFIEEGKKRAEVYEGSKAILAKLSNLFHIELEGNREDHYEDKAKVSLPQDYDHLIDTNNILDNPTSGWIIPIIAIGCVSRLVDPTLKLHMNDFDGLSNL